MTTTNCPGCTRSTRGRTPACSRCMERLPDNLKHALAEHQNREAQIHEDAIDWLSANPRLSERELQILHLVANGHRDGDIAHRLQLSVNTVRDHIKRVCQRLGCTGRPHLMATACQKGYLTTPSEPVCAS